MIRQDQLKTFLDGYFGDEWRKKAAKKDDFANGMQIAGKDEIDKIALGVSLTREFLEKAIEWGAQACIFHHGFDTRSLKSRFSKPSQERLRLIFQNNLTIFGFHYLLDAHPEVGSSSLIIQKLGANLQDQFFNEWGYTGTFDEPQEISGLAKKCEELFGREIFEFYSGPKKITKIGVATGAAKPYEMHFEEMEVKGIGLYISGETSEGRPEMMQELGINYFVCGHYATEVFGIQYLGKIIKEHFNNDIEIKFFRMENPI